MKTYSGYLALFISVSFTIALPRMANAQLPPVTPATWINPATGVAAGDWFNAANWSPAGVPSFFNNARINNGGEARANIVTATGVIDPNLIDLGKNGGTGIFTNDGVDMFLGQSFDIGDVELGFATGTSVVTSNGTATLRDVTNFKIGTLGAGGIDLGKTLAADSAQGFGTGSLTLQRVTTVDVADGIALGKAAGTAQATGDGTLAILDSGSILVGGDIDVGETGSVSGVKNATGFVDINGLVLLQVGGSVDVGKTLGAGGQDNGNGTFTAFNVDTIDVGGEISVGLTSVKNNGVAAGNGSLTIQGVTNLTTVSNIGVGHVRGTSVSGQADAIGSATITDIGTMLIGTDIFVGRNFSKDDVVSTADGTLTIERIGSIQLGADFDVAQVGTGGSGTGLGNAMGLGVAVVRDVVGTFRIDNDIDVGQTNAALNSSTQTDATLTIERVGALNVAVDLDVAQVGGQGQATGIGMLTITDTPMITVGEDMDVGQARGSASSVNTSSAVASISDASISIGFADPGLPGGLDVGNADILGTELADAHGAITFERVNLQVAGRINVGELFGGGTNPASISDGMLTLIDSFATAPVMDVATITPGTAGTVTGTVHLNPSLIDVTGIMTLGAGSTLALDIAGVTRADGTGGPGQYSAIDAGTANLGGALELAGIDQLATIGDHTLTIIAATNPVAGVFAAVPPLNNGVSQGHIGRGQFFEGIHYNSGGNNVTIDVFQAASGDTNGDRKIEQADILNILAANSFNNGTGFDWTQGDFNGDTEVTQADILGILATNLFNAGPYAANPTDPGTPADGVADLIIHTDGTATLDTNGLAINGFILRSLGDNFTGSATLAFAFFQTNEEDEASVGFATPPVTGLVELGQLYKPGSLPIRFSDLDFTYTVANTAGLFDGNCIGCVPEPSSIVLLVMGLVGVVGLGWQQHQTLLDKPRVAPGDGDKARRRADTNALFYRV